MPMPSPSARGVAMLSNAGCSEAAAKTVIALFIGPPPDGPPMQAGRRQNAKSSQSFLRTRQLHADVRGLDHRDRGHAGLQVELVYGLAREQRNKAVGPGLDLDLGGNAILDDASDDAGEAIPGRSRNHNVRRLGSSGLREPGQGGAVDEPLAAGASHRAQAPVVDPAGGGVRADR